MTCEIAVMNKRGLAIAADSAVTVGEGEKIYHHAEKLFALRSGAPVAILVYGSAEIMGAPWELLIHGFAQKLGERHFDRLGEYADDFFRFVEASTALFPPELQRDCFGAVVASYWKNEYAGPLAHRYKPDSKTSPHSASAILLDLLAKDHKEWESCAGIEELGPAFADKLVAENHSMLDAIENQVFGAYKLNPEAKSGLRATVRFMVSRQWIHPAEQSGIVFAGMGEAEPFPALQDFAVGSLVGGRLRRFKTNDAQVTREDSAIVAPFAQGDMVHTFYRGLVPDLDEKLEQIVARSVGRELAKHGNELSEEQLDRLKAAFRKTLEEEIDGRYQRPLIAAVEALPRHELARIAEALVSLTALRRRMSLGEKETVGGAIDVAILSKADGFQWVKRGGRVCDAAPALLH